MKRHRRTASEIRKLRAKLLEAVTKEGRITLTDLANLYGPSIDIRDTISDKTLAKRQLDILARENRIQFSRDGRDLVATAPTSAPATPVPLPEPTPAPTAGPAPPRAPAPQPERTATAETAGTPPELAAIKAYAQQVTAFAETLHQQVISLVKIVEAAKK